MLKEKDGKTMGAAPKTYLPPTPSEVVEHVMPTMADVDYFFENDVINILRNGENAKNLLSGQSLTIPVIRHLYKTFGDEILNRFIEQGWSAIWDDDGVGIKELNSKPHKNLHIWASRKPHESDAYEALDYGAYNARVNTALAIDKPKNRNWLIWLVGEIRKANPFGCP